jgi:hypothetical protein
VLSNLCGFVSVLKHVCMGPLQTLNIWTKVLRSGVEISSFATHENVIGSKLLSQSLPSRRLINIHVLFQYFVHLFPTCMVNGLCNGAGKRSCQLLTFILSYFPPYTLLFVLSEYSESVVHYVVKLPWHRYLHFIASSPAKFHCCSRSFIAVYEIHQQTFHPQRALWKSLCH